MIHSSAPGRAGIVGNPTDGYGGTVISCSLAERASVTLTPADAMVLDVCGCRETIHSREDLRLTGDFTDVAKAVLLTFDCAVESRPFHLKAMTTVPMRAGLAGSTAMLVAILGAVLRLAGATGLNRGRSRRRRGRSGSRTDEVTCGFQDQYMAVFGGLNCHGFPGQGPEERDAGADICDRRAAGRLRGRAADGAGEYRRATAFREGPPRPLVSGGSRARRSSSKATAASGGWRARRKRHC